MPALQNENAEQKMQNAVFPANIYQAMNSIPIEGIPHHPVLYWFRLPFQAVLISWAWWYTNPDFSPVFLIEKGK